MFFMLFVCLLEHLGREPLTVSVPWLQNHSVKPPLTATARKEALEKRGWQARQESQGRNPPHENL